MLVLHPNTWMETDGPAGEAVREGVDVAWSTEAVPVGEIVFVAVSMVTAGVEVFTPMMTGVGV